MDLCTDKIRYEIEAQKRLDLENNERIAKMAAAERERQLAEQRKVDLETITIRIILSMPASKMKGTFTLWCRSLTIWMPCAVKTRSTECVGGPAEE